MWIERRWLVPLVGFSVLLNIFLVGIVAGNAYRAPRNGPRLPLIRQAQLKTLPADERQKFEAVVATQKEGVSAARRAYLATRRAVIAELAAPQFDRARIGARFADMRQAGLLMQEKANHAIVEGLAALTPESRRAVLNLDPAATPDNEEPGGK